MHIADNISLGNLVTWTLTAGAAFITIGQLKQVLAGLVQQMTALRGDFNQHTQEDAANFSRITERLIDMAQRGRFDKEPTGS